MREKSVFVVTFPLKTEPWQEDILNKRINMCHRIYNQCVKKSKNAYKEMIKTKEFRAIKQELKEIWDSKEDQSSAKKKTPREKELYFRLNAIYKENGFTEYGMQNLARIQSRDAGYKKNIDSVTASKIGKRLWTAWNRFLFGDGQDVHFSRYYDFNSVEGSYNTTGIRLLKTSNSQWTGEKWAVVWNKLHIQAQIDDNNMYEQEAMRNEIAYNRILRKVSNGKIRFYVQITFRGTPPQKRDKNTGEFLHNIGNGRVGLYITLTKVTAVTDDGVKVFPLAEEIQKIEEQIAEINRAMDRSRRYTNPDNFNPDGTIKKQGNKKVTWVRSKHYEKLRMELKSLQTKQARIRKNNHERLANQILSLGDDFVINSQDFRTLAQRKKETEIKEDGTLKSKKRFGKVIANYAPAEFIQILEKKLGYYDRTLHQVNLNELGINKLNHATGELEERDPDKEKIVISGQSIDRYTYMAFLLQNLTSDYNKVDINLCDQKFISLAF